MAAMARAIGRHRRLGAWALALMIGGCSGCGGGGGGGDLVAVAPASSPSPPTASPASMSASSPGSPTGSSTGTSTGTATPDATTAQVRFTPTTAEFANPDRGFYGWIGEDFASAFDATGLRASQAAGHRLVLAKVQLDAWREADLPDSLLSALGSRFAAVRAAGMKTALLFNYDFSAGGRDATAAQIQRHLEQLKPVLAANADVIPYMRAGFIGAWGEWHSSKSGNSCDRNSGPTPCATAEANRLTVRDALLANVPATTQIGFRYPADLIRWYPSPSQQARVGLHNDCFLAGPSDSGTYAGAGQRAYAQTLSASTAFGGETCADAEKPLRMGCPDILTEGPAYHLAWLNASDWAGFITAWRNGGCLARVAGFMGYRLQLDAASHPPRVARGDKAVVDVDLRNVGWARFFSARRLVVTLRHRTSGALITAAAGDLRTLVPQAVGSIRLSVPVAIPPDAASGDHDVYLSVPDVFPTTASDARLAVRFANADDVGLGQVWEGGAGRFRVGTVVRVE